MALWTRRDLVQRPWTLSGVIGGPEQDFANWSFLWRSSNKLRATRTGGHRDVEIGFDGKMLTVNNKDWRKIASDSDIALL
jgi:hypothetical protein